MNPRSYLLAAALFASATSVVGNSLADGASASPSSEERRAAAREFAEGQRAFKAGDYPHAGTSFEAAYHHAPHPAPLWNAARAWYRAGELVRAANLYAKYLREAPPKAPDRNSATSALNELSQKLARLEIHAPDMTDVKVDEQPTEGLSVYVNPGAHVVEAHAGDKVVRQSQNVQAGQVVSVALVAPPDTTPVATTTPPPMPSNMTGTTTSAAPPPESKGWSPVVVYVGAGLTAAFAGLTIWSGIDTLNQKNAFNQAPTQDNLDQGKSRETRTNIFLATTIGLGALTAAAAIFLVDWHGSGTTETGAPPAPAAARPTVRVGFGLGSVAIGGTF
jgi:hypothetical protein